MTEQGVEFKGGSLHDGFGGSGEHLALLLLLLQNPGQRRNRDGFDGFWLPPRNSTPLSVILILIYTYNMNNYITYSKTV